MPTNLPPEYYEVEDRYKAAKTTQEKIEALEEMLSTIPKHKGTDHLRADYRRRLSKLKDQAKSQKKSSTGPVSPFMIDKEGAGQAAVIGFANTGKSAFIAGYTNADPAVEPYPFSTWQPTPGMWEIEDVQVQLIDTPPLNRDFVEPELYQLVRRADLILLMVDLQDDPVTQLQESVQYLIDNRIVPEFLKDEYSQRGNKVIPMLVIVNKTDDDSREEDYHIFCQLMDRQWPCVPVSVTTGRNMDILGQRIFKELDIVRIFSKPANQEPDLSAPFVMPRGSTIADFAKKVHKDFYENLKSARVWGKGAEFDGQMVSRDHILRDGDIVELKT